MAHHRHPVENEDDPSVPLRVIPASVSAAAASGSLEAAAAPGPALPPPSAVPLPVLVSHSHTNTQLLLYGSIFLLSLVPGSILLVAKEYIYKVVSLDVVYVSAWVSSIQVAVSFALVPVAVVADGRSHLRTAAHHKRAE